MSAYLRAILANTDASSKVASAERAVQVAEAAYEKSQQRMTRHQASATRAVRQKYGREAAMQLDALDEAREALEDAQQAQGEAAEKEAGILFNLKQPKFRLMSRSELEQKRCQAYEYAF